MPIIFYLRVKILQNKVSKENKCKPFHSQQKLMLSLFHSSPGIKTSNFIQHIQIEKVKLKGFFFHLENKIETL